MNPNASIVRKGGKVCGLTLRHWLLCNPDSYLLKFEESPVIHVMMEFIHAIVLQGDGIDMKGAVSMLQLSNIHPGSKVWMMKNFAAAQHINWPAVVVTYTDPPFQLKVVLVEWGVGCEPTGDGQVGSDFSFHFFRSHKVNDFIVLTYKEKNIV